METKKITKDYIREMVTTNDSWARRAVLAIYQYQTDAEQYAGVTTDDNGVGFSGPDAEILTSFANQLKQGRTLSTKQMNLAKKKMGKYAGQLVRIANSKED